MQHTKGKWEVVIRKDDSYDRPYYEYRILSYPYGIEKGPQGICSEINSEADAKFIVAACNSHDDLLTACERAKTRLLELGQSESVRTVKILTEAITKAEAKDE